VLPQKFRIEVRRNSRPLDPREPTMYNNSEPYLQSELDYRRERATSRRRVHRPRRDPYLPWLLRYGGRKAR
jgi:hypothetical protein